MGEPGLLGLLYMLDYTFVPKFVSIFISQMNETDKLPKTRSVPTGQLAISNKQIYWSGGQKNLILHYNRISNHQKVQPKVIAASLVLYRRKFILQNDF